MLVVQSPETTPTIKSWGPRIPPIGSLHAAPDPCPATSASFPSTRAGSPSLVGPQVRPVRRPGPATCWWWGRLLPIRLFPAPVGADQVQECELRPWVTFPESAGVTPPPGHQDVPARRADVSVRTWYHRCRASPREDTEHTHVRSHTRTHAVTRHTRAHTCSVTHARMYVHGHTSSLMRTHSHAHGRAHACDAHTESHAHTHTLLQAHTVTHTCTRAHSYTCTHT